MIAEAVEFVESKGSGSADASPKPQPGPDGFYDVPTEEEGEIPFL